MQHLEVSGAVRHIYIYVIRRLKVNCVPLNTAARQFCVPTTHDVVPSHEVNIPSPTFTAAESSDLQHV